MLTPQDIITQLQSGNRAALAKAITLAESTLPQHRNEANQVLTACLPRSGNSIRVGITGVPGVGKSTFIEALGLYLIEQGHRVAVLAVDPSSTLSKGSILGDKTRMEELSANANAFIRPTPSGGNLGGVANRTREAIILCEAAGYNIILIETVGVGQSEMEVKAMSDFFLLLMLAGAGDELQGIKRGIMEMADGIAINKADGDNLPKAKAARGDYARAIHLFNAPASGVTPQVELCSALHKQGIDTVWAMIDQYVRHTQANGYFAAHRSTQWQQWFTKEIESQLLQAFYNNPTIQANIAELTKAVANGTLMPTAAAEQLIKLGGL